MWGIWSWCPKGQRRGWGTGRSHGPASSEEPLHRSWPLSKNPSPPSWKQQPLLPTEDVAAPSPCEPAWMGAFHILQSPFLLLDKKALFLPPLSMSWLNLLGKVIRLGASLWAWRGVEDKKRVIEFTRKGNWGDRVIKLVGLEKDTRMIFKRLSECSHTKLNYCNIQ